MTRILLVLVIAITVFIHCAVAQPPANSPIIPSPVVAPPVVVLPIVIPTDSEIRQILVDRIDKERQSVGIVVGVIEPAG